MTAVYDRMDMIDDACSQGDLVQYMTVYLINKHWELVVNTGILAEPS